MAEHPTERRDRLTAALEAARARAAARRNLEWADVGDVLDALSHDLNEVTHLEKTDHAAAHAHYDRIEQRLSEVDARLGDDPADG
jgi:ribosome assembly protein YihI (activator of Der GTPase)